MKEEGDGGEGDGEGEESEVEPEGKDGIGPAESALGSTCVEEYIA